MKTRHYITIGIVIAFTITFFVLGPSQDHIAQYFLTDKQFEEIFLGESHVNDFRDTQNPNECWYQEDDGSLTPCKIDDGGPSMMFGMFLVVFWPWIVLGITIAIIFIVWKKRK